MPTAHFGEVWQRNGQFLPLPNSSLRNILPVRLPGILYTLAEHDGPSNDGWKELYNKGPQDQSIGLRYKTYEGNMVNRQAFLMSLVLGLKAVIDDALIWTFPVMDVADKQRADGILPFSSFEKVDPIVTAEPRIMTQLIHLASGTPKNENVTEIVNEAVCHEAEEDGKLVKQGVAGVTWSKALGGLIRQALWSGKYFGDTESAVGVSGL